MNTEAELEYKLLTTKEAAKAWGVSPGTVRKFVQSGHLRPHIGKDGCLLGKGWRFRITDVECITQRL